MTSLRVLFIDFLLIAVRGHVTHLQVEVKNLQKHRRIWVYGSDYCMVGGTISDVSDGQLQRVLFFRDDFAYASVETLLKHSVRVNKKIRLTQKGKS